MTKAPQKLANPGIFCNFGLNNRIIMHFLRNFKTVWIIHIFALLHAGVALGCRLIGVEDELLLTILTMTMVLLICVKRNLSIELTAACIIIANILGYLIGNAGAQLFALIFKTPWIIHSLATILTTELLGWSVLLSSKLFRKGRVGKDPTASSYLSWLILAMAVIFFLRLAFILMLADETSPSGSSTETSLMILSNSFALIILICINILYVWSSKRFLKRHSLHTQFLSLTVFTLVVSLVEALLVFHGQTKDYQTNATEQFIRLYLASLIAQVTIYCLVYMVNYAITAQHKMLKERGKANEAQYRYQILKRQVNPHFLFNSLNVLDCLVCDEKTEQASTYIHKLAGIYRYMIKSEEEQLVTLEEELTFVEKFVDLMQVRFPEGFNVEINVPTELRGKFVLPCSIQLLIENAVKHNVINAGHPLVISITATAEHISVCNNVIPKVTQVSSTGLGQKYIRQQYLNLCGKEIEISKTEETYKVILPLI